MTIKAVISELRKSPISAWYYIQGNVRFWLYGNKRLKWLLRKHIVEQYEWRRDVKAKSCYWNGSCKCCGCETPQLFFADKKCSAGDPKYRHCKDMGLTQCFPEMKSKDKWDLVPYNN